MCGSTFETEINGLLERADVYCLWMDGVHESKREPELPKQEAAFKREF